MVAFLESLRQMKVYVQGRRCRETNYRHLYRFDEDTDTWMAEYLLVDIPDKHVGEHAGLKFF